MTRDWWEGVPRDRWGATVARELPVIRAHTPDSIEIAICKMEDAEFRWGIRQGLGDRARLHPDAMALSEYRRAAGSALVFEI